MSLERLADVEREIFARRPEHKIDPSLERIAALATLLGDPHRAYPVIHVTGTNGKTSTARMAEALLRARGLRTGLFTSPHLSSVTERIRVDGEPLSDEAFLAAYDDVAPYVAMVDERQGVGMSFFEVLTGMAFAAFADATNIVDGAVAVVTPVGIDHTAYLGDTVTEIAGEKAGIIKPGATAVLAAQPPDAAAVLLRRASEVGADVVREGVEFGVAARELAVGGQQVSLHGLGGEYPDLFLPAFGAYQASNAACALAAVEALSGVGAGEEGGGLDPELVREAFEGTATPGRLEVVRRSPVVVVDSGHNPGGMANSLAGLTEAFAFDTIVAVLAVPADKDVAGLLDEMEPVVDELVVTRNSSSRSMDVAELARLAASVFGPERVRSAGRLEEAIETAVGLADMAEADGRPGSAGVLVTGSVVTAGDARVLLRAPGTRDGAL